MKGKTLLALALALAVLPAVPARAAETEDAALEDYARRLQEAQSDIKSRQVGLYGMVPVYGTAVADGVYPVEADSSSKFFKVTDAELIVENGQLSVRFTIPSMSYLYVYPGTSKEAAAAPESDWIGFTESDHQTVFTLPIQALDAPVPCAAYSKSRKKWYNRSLCFYASSLPPEALAFPLPDYELIRDALTAYAPEGLPELPERESEEAEDEELMPAEPAEIHRPDGEYSIAVDMSGGSGRASISSPTVLVVRDGHAWARITWSSAYYDYMLMGDDRFENLTVDGGLSVFEIPIPAFDEPVSVIADTTAMGEGVEIHYSLVFYLDSVGPKSQIPQEAAKRVLVLAAALIVLGGVANHFIKKKRKG